VLLLLASFAAVPGACVIAHHTARGAPADDDGGGADARTSPADARAAPDHTPGDAVALPDGRDEGAPAADVYVADAAPSDVHDEGAPDASAPDSGPCPPGELLCGSMCTDVSNSHFNCGACGNACGTATCQMGSCHCSWPRTFCHGACILLGSTDNCSACDDRCANVCLFGACL
jgi:hypothetical protein